MRPSIALLVFAGGLALGQAAGGGTEFEVASIRPAAPLAGGRGGRSGGPGTSDPGQITWRNAALIRLLQPAYNVKPYQLIGPTWLDSDHFDIAVKVPAGATQEQVSLMWQNLLAERFGLKAHHESKELEVDELVVAKGGPKFKETTIDPNAERGPSKLDENGFPALTGAGMISTITAGPNGPRAKRVAKAQEVSTLAAMLDNQFSHPVVDKTGLTGKYDFSIEFALRQAPGTPGAEASDPGLDLVAAIEQQLGLRLVKGKGNLDVVVIDHLNRVPTGN